MIISIILTVYNKENYLRRVFNALLNQKEILHANYEVIVINDGSTDGSEIIIEEYAKKDNIIRAFSQENQGLSMARNNGVEVAKGDYVWFVDADDTISLSAVKLVYEATKSYPDIIPIYAKTDGIDHIRNAVDPNSKSGREILKANRWEQCGVFYVYKKSFLKDNNLQFLPGIYHEDAEFTPRMLYFAETVKVIPEILYIVYRDPDSITQIPRAKRAFDYLEVSERLSKFILERGEDNTETGISIANNVAQDINNAFFIICKNSVDEQRKLNEQFYQSRKLLLYILSKAQNKKYRVEALLFRLFPNHYVGIYKMMQALNKRK